MKIKNLTLGILLLLSTVLSDARADSDSFVIIVNANKQAKGINQKFLSNVFFKKITVWHDGETISPVDLNPESRVRRAFSVYVLNRPVPAVRSYWQQMIFSGQAVQPLEFDSEAQVVRYVAEHPNAVGYVSASAALSAKVKTVSWK